MAYNHSDKGGSAEGRRPSSGSNRNTNRFNASKKRTGNRGDGRSAGKDGSGNGNGNGRNKRVRHNGTELSQHQHQHRQQRSRYAASYDDGTDSQQYRPSRYEGGATQKSQPQRHEEQYRRDGASSGSNGKFLANLPRGPRVAKALPTAPAAAASGSRYDGGSSSRQGSPLPPAAATRSRNTSESPIPVAKR